MKLLALLIVLLTFPVQAETGQTGSESISRMLSLVIGFAERPALHAWRKSSLTIRPIMGQISEQNNFDSYHFGLVVDVPSDSFSFQIGLRKVEVSDTPSSRQLALTPFKQAGHANRYDIISGVKLPLVEGVGSQLYDWIPQSQFVFQGIARVNWHLHPNEWKGESFQNVLQGLFQTKVGSREYQKMQESNPAALLPSRSRHSLGAGFVVEQYFPESGGTAFHCSFEVLTLIDLYSDETTPSRWMEYNLGVGYDM